MANFIEFPVFNGVSGDLKQWILWLEAFFVREKFTALEKMNLAQSLLKGKAEVWFYRNQRMLPFQSWEDLKDNLLLMFGEFGDSYRLLQAQRVEQKKKRMKTTSIPEKNSIRETITVVEETSEIVAGKLDERASEKKLVSQYQVPVSSLEPGLSFSSESLDVSQAWQSEIVSNNRVHSQAGVGCVKNKNNAHHVFDELFRMLHDPGGRKAAHSDDIFETEVDIDKVQGTQRDTVVEACEAEIDVLDGTATWIVTSQPATNIEDASGNRLLAIQQKETVSAYVTAFEELSTQVIALEDSHLEQIFNEGLKTEMQEVLKLKAPVDVIALVFLDLKKCFFQGAEKRDVQMMLLVKANDAHVDSLMCCDVTFFLKHKWRFKYKGRLQKIKLTDTMFLWEKVYMVSCLSLDAQFHSLEFQLKHKWRSKHLYTMSALEFQVVERIGVVVFKVQPLPMAIAAVLDSFAPVFVIVETLGYTTVICSDKPGTLTTKQMAVSKLVTAICNDASVVQSDQQFVSRGMTTEATLKVLVEKMGFSEGLTNASSNCCRLGSELALRIATLAFDRDRKSMGVMVGSSSGNKLLLVKSAVENVLERSTSIQLLAVSVQDLDQYSRDLILQSLHDMSMQKSSSIWHRWRRKD